MARLVTLQEVKRCKAIASLVENETPKSGNKEVDDFIQMAQDPLSDYLYVVKDFSDSLLNSIYKFTKKYQDIDDVGITLAYSAVEGELGDRARKQGKSFDDEWSRMIRGEVGLNRDKPKGKPSSFSHDQNREDEQYEYFMKNFSNSTEKELDDLEGMAGKLKDTDKKAGYKKAIRVLRDRLK